MGASTGDFVNEEGLGGAAGGAALGTAVLPGVGTGVGAGLGYLYGIYKHHQNSQTANKYKGDLDAAQAGNDKRMEALKQFYLQQQKQALGYFSPVQQMYQGYYGTGGVQAPQTPQAPGTPLSTMYRGA